MIYADVIIDISHEKLDRDFQYRVPEELVQAIKPGVVVKGKYPSERLCDRDLRNGKI